MNSDGTNGLGSGRQAARAAEVIGAELIAGAEISTDAFRRLQRGSLAVRASVFASGFVLAATVGLGWVVLSFGAVAHHFVSRSRQAVVSTRNGLHLVIASSRRAAVVAEWPALRGAELILRPGEPDIAIVIDEWRGRASGLDIEAIEATIRAAGGEPLRVVDRSGGF